MARNALLVLVSGYIVLFMLFLLQYGIFLEVMPSLYSLIALPFVFLLGRFKEFVKSWIPFLSLWLSYEALSGVAGVLATTGKILPLYPFDEILWGFNLTGAVQSALYSPVMTSFMSILYSLHFPMVVATSVFFWYMDKKAFDRYVYAFVIVSYMALTTFILLPTAPPWYSGVAQDLYGGVLSTSTANLSALIATDKFAAFPSLHTAYAVLFSYCMIRSRLGYGLVALPLTAGILFSTIYLGQHYVIDLIAGAIYLALAILVTEMVLKRRNRGLRTVSNPTPVEKMSPTIFP